MIVKNEEKVLARALQSVCGLIDYWVVCDTGSTDATPAIVLDNLSGIPGELHRVEWVNFGYNRTQVLEMAREKADYLLIMDADMVLRVQGDFKHKLHLDYYEIRYEGPLDYTQPMLLSGHHHWQYVGVTHEYLYAETAQTWDFLPELSLLHLADDGRVVLRDALARFTAAGERRIHAWVATQRCVEVPFEDARAFANANTPDELRRLQGEHDHHG